MLFCENVIITMRNRKVMAVQDIEALISRGRGPDSKGDFLVMIADRIADRMADVIQELEEAVDDLEDLILTTDSFDLQSKIFRYQGVSPLV